MDLEYCPRVYRGERGVALTAELPAAYSTPCVSERFVPMYRARPLRFPISRGCIGCKRLRRTGQNWVERFQEAIRLTICNGWRHADRRGGWVLTDVNKRAGRPVITDRQRANAFN